MSKKHEKLDENHWVGNAACSNPGADELRFIENRSKVRLLAEITDNNACYDYDNWALCELDGKYYLLSTSGCSCPSPSETWHVQMGPTTLAGIKKRLLAGEYDGYTVPSRQMGEFIAAIEKAQADVKNAAKRAKARQAKKASETIN